MAVMGDLRRLALVCCKLYISESQNVKALEMIETAARSHKRAPLLHVFDDKDYNRVGYTVAGSLGTLSCQTSPPGAPFPSVPIRSAVVDMVRAAVANIDLREHSGSHPRIGVVDHICFNTLGETSSEEVASLARSVAADIGSELEVPTFLYGSAHPKGQQLDSIRRALGYFQSNNKGVWVGSPDIGSSLAPDFGPNKVSARTGVVVVGACPWVMNYNVPLMSTDLATGRKIAQRVSFRGGGLPEVQSMALMHGDSTMEIACNLLNVDITSPKMVQDKVEQLAKTEQLEVKLGYLTGHTEEEVLELALRKMLSTISSRDGLSTNPYVRGGKRY